MAIERKKREEGERERHTDRERESEREGERERKLSGPRGTGRSSANLKKGEIDLSNDEDNFEKS